MLDYILENFSISGIYNFILFILILAGIVLPILIAIIFSDDTKKFPIKKITVVSFLLFLLSLNSSFQILVDNKFSDALKNKDYMVSDFKLFKKNPEKQGFQFFKNKSSKVSQLVGEFSCGELKLKECIDELRKNEESIISASYVNLIESKIVFSKNEYEK